MATYRTRDRLTGDIEVTGELLGEINTRFGSPGQRLRRGSRDRWGVNHVFRISDGSYVLVREAFSLVYHRRDTTCRISGGALSGDECSVADMDAELARLDLDVLDAVPCDRCDPTRPPELLDDDKIRYEFPRLWVDRCDTGEQVRDALTMTRREPGRSTTFLPVPARALLEQCVKADPGFFGQAVLKIS